MKKFNSVEYKTFKQISGVVETEKAKQMVKWLIASGFEKMESVVVGFDFGYAKQVVIENKGKVIEMKIVGKKVENGIQFYNTAPTISEVKAPIFMKHPAFDSLFDNELEQLANGGVKKELAFNFCSFLLEKGFELVLEEGTARQFAGKFQKGNQVVEYIIRFDFEVFTNKKESFLELKVLKNYGTAPKIYHGTNDSKKSSFGVVTNELIEAPEDFPSENPYAR